MSTPMYIPTKSASEVCDDEAGYIAEAGCRAVPLLGERQLPNAAGDVLGKSMIEQQYKYDINGKQKAELLTGQF